MKQFYFKIPAAQVFEVVYAENLEQAKIKTFNEWARLWSQIDRVTPDTITQVRLPHV